MKPSIAELRAAYAGKRVLLTGHTGFKGGWLALWLAELGAEVTGFALAPETSPALFDAVGVERTCRHILGDLRDRERLRAAVREARPDFVFHLAAQALVRRSYAEPLETLETNVLGTAALLETLRQEQRPCAVVVVTSDKCYENREWSWGYREDDPMGGHDVYSMSKGAAELVTSSYRRSFFPPDRLEQHGVAVATVRAGNVIGGGDWSKDRLVPDIVRSLAAGEPVGIRNPRSVRPWQHVLEPLGGYLVLGAALASADARQYCEAWNFGPRTEDAEPVSRLVEQMIELWGAGRWVDWSEPSAPHEAGVLRLSIDKAFAKLGWQPRWNVREALQQTVTWYRAHLSGASADELRALCIAQIRAYGEARR
ncbi:MAG: CDP-glucose 4,6-dehydratase [Myxococcales bacterium]